jgi:hypothetical protein
VRAAGLRDAAGVVRRARCGTTSASTTKPALEEPRRRVRGAAPIVRFRPQSELVLHVARVDLAPLHDEVQNLPRLARARLGHGGVAEDGTTTFRPTADFAQLALPPSTRQLGDCREHGSATVNGSARLARCFCMDAITEGLQLAFAAEHLRGLRRSIPSSQGGP